MKIHQFANWLGVCIFLLTFYWEAGRLSLVKIGPTSKVYLSWQLPAYEEGDKILIWTLEENQEKIRIRKITGDGGNVYKIDGESGEYGKIGTVIPRLIVGKVLFEI